MGYEAIPDIFDEMNTMTSVADRDSILKKYGYTVDEIRDIFVFEELDDNQYDILWDRGKPEELDSEGAVDKQMQDNINFNEGEEEIVSEWEPDYSKTAEYEGTGITSELIPGEGLVAPILTGMGVDPTTAAVIGAVATKKPGMLTNKLFAGKKLKANQLKNRGAEGPVVQGASRTLKESNLRPSIKNKTADRYKSMSDRVKTKRAAEAATVAGAGTAMYLAGDMTDDEIVTGHPPLTDPYEKPKTQGRDLKGNRNEQGDFISRLGEHNIKVDLNKIARGDDEVGVDEPTGPDMVEAEERPGWKKNPGANWWSVNSKSDYWQTDDGAEEAFELYGEYPSWVKQPEVQELDWSSWFK